MEWAGPLEEYALGLWMTAAVIGAPKLLTEMGMKSIGVVGAAAAIATGTGCSRAAPAAGCSLLLPPTAVWWSVLDLAAPATALERPCLWQLHASSLCWEADNAEGESTV